MTKNELITVTALSFCQAAVRHCGINPKMHKAVKEAFLLWGKEVSKSNRAQMSKWFGGFIKSLWKGKPQEAHTNLSFGIAIMEYQADFLRGRKLDAVDQVIAIMTKIYANLPKPEGSEHLCNDIAVEALAKWKEVVSH